jgi:hypothetical protein
MTGGQNMSGFTWRQLAALVAFAALISGIVGGLTRFAIGNERRFLSVETADKLYFSRAEGVSLFNEMTNVKIELREIRQQMRDDSQRDAAYQRFIREALEQRSTR